MPIIKTERKLAWFAVIGGIIAAFMSILDIQIVNAAIGKIQVAVHAPLADGSWVSSAYLIPEIIGIPLSHVALSYLGTRRTALVFCAGFIAASLLCAQMSSLNGLILCRLIQGFCAGVIMSLAYIIIITRLTNKADNQLAIILFGAVVSIAPTVGPLLSGLITNFLSWKFLFYINLPFGVLAIWLMLTGLANEKFMAKQTKIDWVGVITISIALGSLQYTLEEGYKYNWFQSGFILSLFIIAILSLLSFIIYELLVGEPLINLRLLKNPSFAIACSGSFIGGAAMFAFLFMIPYLLISVYNYTPIQISYVVMWIGFAQLFMIIFARYILSKLNIFFMIACGFFLFALSVLLWSSLSMQVISGLIILSGILRGISSTFFLTPLGILATTSAPKEHAASASALYNITRSLGGAIGVAAITSFINLRKDYYTILPTLSSKGGDLAISAYKLAFADAFSLLSILLFITGILFILVRIFLVRFFR